MTGVTEGLIADVKKLIIERLKLEEIAVEDITTDAPLFGEGLGLDSIDALELVVLLEKNYGIKLHTPKEEGPKIFYSIKTMAEYILDHQKK